MEFSKELRDDVIAGDITVSFRLWRRPKVKASGRYPVGPAHIVVADVRRSGEPDLETLRRRAAHAGPIGDGTLLYRVEFHVVRD